MGIINTLCCWHNLSEEVYRGSNFFTLSENII